MKRKILFGMLFCFITQFAFCLPPSSGLKASLTQFETEWNKGHLNQALTSYKNSRETLYISSSKVIHGYSNILHRYQTQYSTSQAMGKLSFSHVEIKTLSPRYAMAIGYWYLSRHKMKALGGIFTLLYEKTSKGWKIVVDHTS